MSVGKVCVFDTVTVGVMVPLSGVREGETRVAVLST